MFSDTDFAHMQRALTLAARGMYTTTPNPRVGCVIVKDGEVIGEGFTQPAGQDHAEVQALKDARARGHDVAGSTFATRASISVRAHGGVRPKWLHGSSVT